MRKNWVSATRPDGEVVYLNLATARAACSRGNTPRSRSRILRARPIYLAQGSKAEGRPTLLIF